MKNITSKLLLTSMAFAMANGLASAGTKAVHASADLYTTRGMVTSVDDRLLVSGAQTSFLTFDLAPLQGESIRSAELKVYLAANPNNEQTTKSVNAIPLVAVAAAGLRDDGVDPEVGSPFEPSLSKEVVTSAVTGSGESGYFIWDVTELVAGAVDRGDKFFGVALLYEGGGAPFRFTDRDPSNDSSTASRGSPPLLWVETE